MISRQEFDGVLALEEKSLVHYDRMLAQLSDERVRGKIQEIRDDEQRHIELAKKVLSIIFP